MKNSRHIVLALACIVPSLGLAGAPLAGADPIGIERSYTTEVSWTPPSCIGVDVAERTGGTRPEQHCNMGDPNPKRINQVVPSGAAHVGANPKVMWGTNVSCKVTEDATGRVLAEQTGLEGPDLDVNCLTVVDG